MPHTTSKKQNERCRNCDNTVINNVGIVISASNKYSQSKTEYPVSRLLNEYLTVDVNWLCIFANTAFDFKLLFFHNHFPHHSHLIKFYLKETVLIRNILVRKIFIVGNQFHAILKLHESSSTVSTRAIHFNNTIRSL